MPAVIAAADQRLRQLRTHVPDAGGMIIASDRTAARAYAALLKKLTYEAPTVVLSDDPGSSARITQFAQSTSRWLVAVRMVSEGVDIPRLRVGVFATTTTTELFFRQAVGRLVRWTRGVPRQRSWLFIPDDPRLRRHAALVAEQRRHSLRRDEHEERSAERTEIAPDDEQMSLFAALSAVATDVRESTDHDDAFDDDVGAGEEFELVLAPPPPLAGGDATNGTVTLTRKEEKLRLREENATVARELVRRTRFTHGQVNAELNRLSGVRKVSEATIEQLERRVRAADRWLAKS